MKRLKVILLVLLGIYVFGGVGLYFLQERFIFLDETLPQNYAFQFESDFKEVKLEQADGGQLHGLHFTQNDPKGLILYYHGNADNLTRWGKVVQHHYQLGYDVLVMDYRGYGKSIGNRSQETMLADALAWYAYANESYDESTITVYGRSLGTGLACYAASENNPLKLILETPYHDFQSLAQRYYPVFPVGLALRFNFKSNEYVKNVHCPVYIFHGTEDRVVPYSHGQRLYEVIPQGQAELITIPDGEHVNLVEFEKFREELKRVLE